MEIKKSNGIKGEITVAPDKSISHRAVIFGALSKGKTVIENFLAGEDCFSTVQCFQRLGIPVVLNGNLAIVEGKGLYGLKNPGQVLFAGNSGTTARLLCGILAPQQFESVLDGDDSLRKRPMGRVIEPLRLMGADIKSTQNMLPVSIQGKRLKGIDYKLPVASAQLKSALILAGLYAEGQTVLTEPVPSRNHTELMLQKFGGDSVIFIEKDSDQNRITVNPSVELTANSIRVPGDISSAAFFIAAALIVPNSQLVIKNVGLNPTRTGILDVFMAMGADIKIENVNDDGEAFGDITIRSSALHGTEIGGDLVPRLIDEIPIIAVAAAFAKGTTVIRDAQELRYKESDRIWTMTAELKKAGIEAEATEDGLIVKGSDHVRGGCFESYQDHRIAMSLAVLALGAEGYSQINGHECINISYPEFFTTLNYCSE